MNMFKLKKVQYCFDKNYKECQFGYFPRKKFRKIFYIFVQGEGRSVGSTGLAPDPGCEGNRSLRILLYFLPVFRILIHKFRIHEHFILAFYGIRILALLSLDPDPSFYDKNFKKLTVIKLLE